MRLRAIRPDDRSSLRDLLEGTEQFNREELDCALEMVGDSVVDPEGSGYFSLVATDEDDRPIGYAIFGPTPLTDATWDLYWIVTRRELRGRGVGRALIGGTENEVRRRGGRIVRIETSTAEGYGSTRVFYERVLYRVVGHIPDFYRKGDDLVIFAKDLARAEAREPAPLRAA